MKRCFIMLLTLALILFSSASADGIDYTSSPEGIDWLQNWLIHGGIMSSSKGTGIYDSATIEAVARFQEWVNEKVGGTVLPVTGMADEQTLNYLILVAKTGVYSTEETVPQSEVQTKASQPVKADIVDSGSDDVRAVQQALQKVGLLSEAEISGFSDASTNEALKKFQVWVNKTRGEETLSTNGICDPLTRAYLDYCVEHQFIIEKKPAQSLESPTSISKISAPVITISAHTYLKNEINYIQDSSAVFNWKSDGDVQFYTVNLLHEDGVSYALGNTTDTSKTISLDQLQPGLYKLYVSATPAGGSKEDAVQSELLFGISAAAIEPVTTEAPVEQTSAHIECIDANSNSSDIQAVQMALYSLDLLDAASARPGVLDDATLEATAQFQAKVNDAYQANLSIIDPSSDRFIDSATIELLLYSDLKLPETDESPMTNESTGIEENANAAAGESVALMTGVESIDISALQLKLIESGLLNGEPSGYYDISTYSAVKEMQRRLGLEDSGIIDQEFLSLINQ